jgi:RNA polymerase sigma-70 factor, ECF subfamily
MDEHLPETSQSDAHFAREPGIDELAGSTGDFDVEGLAPLLASAKAGSVEAIGEALEGCRSYLLLIANRELGEDLQAKLGASDLVQETFLEAHKGFQHFHGGTSKELLAWLVGILENRLAQAKRKFAGTQKRDVSRERPIEAVGQSPASSEQASPATIVEREDEERWLRAAIDKLPVDYRRAIELRALERRSFAEIGAALERTPDAARKLWARAVARLEQELAAIDADPRPEDRRHERSLVET